MPSMSGLKIICPICTEEFCGNDDIYSTSCGHLYHYTCMQEWKGRSSSCPQCREYNPTQHKIFLNLEDNSNAPTAPSLADVDIKVKLDSSVDKIHELRAELQESEINFFHMQEQYTNEQQIRKQLEQRLAQFRNNESDFLSLHAQYSEIEDRSKILQEEIERLTIENEYKSKELALNATKISSLELSVAATKGSSDTTANTKITMLQQKLKHVTDELQREISNSTNLAIDKMKLQSYIQRMDMQANLSGTNNTVQNTNIVNNRNTMNVPAQSGNISGQDISREMDSTSILLYNLPLKSNIPLKLLVTYIAEIVRVPITEDDIKNVKPLHGRTHAQNNAVYVQFKTDVLKKNFLTNREKLKKDPVFGKVTIKEFIDERIHSLFMYARKKLVGQGFDQITCKDNQIIAKRHPSKGPEVLIRSKEQVDGLTKTHLEKNGPTIYLQEDKIDNSYYKII